ncbi:MAG: hypothetical protein IAE79_25810, partial [Anaerolinea sp.]|nr:hypothetical protein [Anaerolinea sp.]
MLRHRRSLTHLFYWVFLAACMQIFAWQPIIAEGGAGALREALSLTIQSPPPGLLALNGQFTLDMSVTNAADVTLSSVQMHLPYHPDILYTGASGMLADPVSSATLNLNDLAAGETRSLAVTVTVRGLPRQQQISLPLQVTAPGVDPVVTPTSFNLHPFVQEQNQVTAAGSFLQLDNGRFQANFPSGWHNQNAEVSFQLLEQHRQTADERGVFLAFALEATANGSPITQFDTPVTLSVQIDDLVDLNAISAEDVRVYTRETEADAWQAIPATLETATGVLTITTPHFSFYQLETEEPTPWELAYTPPQASAFTGAATYGYTFALPPGVGGLAPQLSLSYSSRGVDSLRRPVMSSGFGVGWGMPQAEIINGNASSMYENSTNCCGGADRNHFTLALDGATYRLSPVGTHNGWHGRYIASGDPSLSIEFINGNNDNSLRNVTGEYWLVRTAANVTYRFGYIEDAEQVVTPISSAHNSFQPRNRNFAAASWKVDTITDAYGRQIRYTYGTRCGREFAEDNCRRGPTTNDVPESYAENALHRFGLPPNLQNNQPPNNYTFRTEVDVALSEILYNFVDDVPQTRVLFDYYWSNWTAVRDDTYMLAGHFAPIRIVTKHGDQIISAYAFTFEGGEHYVANLDLFTNFWWVTSITAYGSDYDPSAASGTALPIQTFTYEQESDACQYDAQGGRTNCVKLLTGVANGYGAVSDIIYGRYGDDGAPASSGRWFHVTDIYTWDGVSHVHEQDLAATRIRYDRGGFTACYDVDGSGCRTPYGEASNALVGFSGVQTEALTWDGTDWVALTRQRQEFSVTNYWLNGKRLKSQDIDPQNGDLLTEYTETWEWDDGAKFAHLDATSSKSFHPGDSSKNLGTQQTFAYDLALQGGQQWGRATMVNTAAIVNDAVQGIYRRVITAYQTRSDSEYRLIVPYQQSLHDADWNLQQAALYLYDGSADPDNQTLAIGELRWQLNVLVPAEGVGSGLSNLSATAVSYDYYGNSDGLKRGLLKDTTTYTGEAIAPLTPGQGWGTVTTPAPANWRNRTTLAYTNDGLTPISQQVLAQDGPSQLTSFAYVENIPWLLETLTAPNLVTTRYEYDPFGRLFAVYDGVGDGDPRNSSPMLRYRYWDNTWNSSYGLHIPFSIGVETRPGDNTVPLQTHYTYYDGLGRAIQERELSVNVDDAGQQDIVVINEYDALGRAICATAPFTVTPGTGMVTDACSAHERTTTTYDALGRVQSVTAPDGNSQTGYYYAILNDLNSPTAYHRVVSVVDANQHATSQYYDAFNQLAAVREYTGVQPPYAPYATTTYTYDLLDNLRAVRDARNNQTEIEYDSLGRKTWMNDPDMGEWTYRYDAAGNLTWQQDEAGQVLCFWYDGLNRMTAKRHSEDDAICETGDTLLAAYSYHPDGVGEKGQLQEIRWPDTNNRETFDYDPLGRLTMHTRIIDGQEYLMQYGDFDALHRPQELIYPDTEVVQITYDREGENSLSTTFSGALVNDVRYNERGQMTTFDRDGALDTTYSYYLAAGSSGNNNFRLKTIQHGAINDNLPSFTYTYDRMGNVKSIGERIQNNTAMQNFDYDHLDRLDIACTWTGSACHDTPNLSAGQYNHNYNYDVLGNISQRIEKDGDATTTYTYTYGAKPHAVTAVTGGSQPQNFTYDPNGNMETRQDVSGNFAQEFDVENRLVRVTDNATGSVTQFFYDASGQRVMTVQPDETVIHTPFPNYEVEQRQPAWLSVNPPPVNLTTPDDDSRFLATGDAPGWGLSLSQQAQWAANLLPVTVDDLTATADADFPATSRYTGSGIGAPHSAGGQPMAVNNLAQGMAQSPDIDLIPGREYRLRIWVKSNYTGEAAIYLLPYGNAAAYTKIWPTGSADPESGTQIWQEINVTFIMPASEKEPPPASKLQLAVGQINGWVAFDNLRLYELNGGKAAYGFEEIGGDEPLIYSTGFEPGHNWDSQPDPAFPATAIWNGDSGPATPQQGPYSLTLSNLGHDASLTSPLVGLPAGSSQLTVQMQVQKDLANIVNGNADGVALTVHYYDNDGMILATHQIWHSDQLANSPGWQTVSLTDSVPPNAVSFLLSLSGSFYDGWIAFNDVSAAGVTWDFNTPTWTEHNNSDFPAGKVWYGLFNGLGLPGQAPDYGHVYAFTNRARAVTNSSTWFDAVPFQSYRIEGWVRGQFAGNVGSGKLWLEYSNGGQVVQRVLLWSAASQNSVAWQPVSENITVPIYADRLRLVVVAERLSGWLAIDDVTVLDQTQPTPWRVTNTWEQTTNTLPATGMAGANAPHSGDGTALTLHNLAAGDLTSPPILLVGGQTYTVEAWVNPHLLAGAVHLEVVPFGNDAQTMKIWEMNAPVNGAWQLVVTSFTLPSGPAQPSYLRWRVMELDGWVAVDDVVIREVSVDSDDGDIVFTDDFETESGWVAAENPNFPATSIWRGDAGPAAPHSGNASAALSNLGAVNLVSPRIAIDTYKVILQFWLRSQWQTEGSAGGFAVSARYYGGERGGEYLGEFPLWSSSNSTNGWKLIETNHTPPPTATEIELWFSSAFSNGWAALDDIVVRDADTSDILAAWDFEKIEILPPQAEEWAVFAHDKYPAGTAFWQEDVGRGGTNLSDTSAGFLFTNEAGGVSQTGLFPATPGQAYHLRASLNADAAFGAPARLLLRFYNGATPNGPDTPVWTSGAGEEPAPGSWQAVNRTFTIPPNTTHFQLILESPRLGGRLRLDGVTLANLSSAIPAQAGQTYELAALVAGDAPAAGQESAALVVTYYNSGGAWIGADTVWAGVDYSQVPGQVPDVLQSGSFTTPSNTAHLRIGLAASV